MNRGIDDNLYGGIKILPGVAVIGLVAILGWIGYRIHLLVH